MSAGVLELVVPDELDGRALMAALAERLTVEVDRATTSDRELLDTFDARLRDAGLRAEWPAGRTARRRLTLREPGMPPRSADVDAGPSVPLAAVPPGPVRDRLAPVLEERALISVARVRSRVLRAAVLNGDDKTVVRLAVEHPVVDGHELPARLLVEPVRGYERDFDRVVGRLRDRLGLEPADVPLFDAAVTAAGGRPEGVQTKPEFELQRGTRTDAAAGVVLLPLADIAEANVQGVLDDLDTEFLHDLRVSVRRARSVLRELKDVHPPAQRARLRTELKWVQTVTGPLRDLDVQLLEWEEVAGERADELAPLRALLEQRRARELVRVRRALTSRRFGAVLELRYLLELFGGLFPSDVVKPLVRALKDLQDVLGRFQDRSVQTEMLRENADELAAVSGGPGAVLAAGLVVSALEADQRDARAHFAERFEAFASSQQRKIVRDTFARLR
jgi:CHAD domain-containing protein